MSGTVQVFDGHNDTILKLERAARNGSPLDFAGGAVELDIDLPRARASDLAGGFFAMFTPNIQNGEFVAFDRTDSRRYAQVDRPAALDLTLSMFARMRRLAAERLRPRCADLRGRAARPGCRADGCRQGAGS